MCLYIHFWPFFVQLLTSFSHSFFFPSFHLLFHSLFLSFFFTYFPLTTSPLKLPAMSPSPSAAIAATASQQFPPTPQSTPRNSSSSALPRFSVNSNLMNYSIPKNDPEVGIYFLFVGEKKRKCFIHFLAFLFYFVKTTGWLGCEIYIMITITNILNTLTMIIIYYQYRIQHNNKTKIHHPHHHQLP